jgi:hypothetical protein
MPAGGGIIQLAAKGRQNEHLNAKPEFTLFKTSHNRYTNFAEDVEFNDFNGMVTFGGQKVSSTISRYGDLITDLMLWVQLPPLVAPIDIKDISGNTVIPELTAAYWVNAIGYALIEEVSIEIGSQDVDTLYQDWLFVWEELTQRPGARIREQIGRFDWNSDVETDMIAYSSKARTLWIQLPFWFNKYFLEKGLSVPLISLTYHEVKVKVTFANIGDITCVVYKESGSPVRDLKWWLVENSTKSTPMNGATNQPLQNSDLTAKLLVTYVYLDNNERNAFAEADHEYVITTTQRQIQSITTQGATQDSIKLYFNHPSNLILWIVRPISWNTSAGRRRYSVGYKDRFDWSSKVSDSTETLLYGDVTDPITNATLRLNSHERWPENMDSTYFRVVQPQLKFENIPAAYIYVYVFAISGGTWNPTSTLNFSRIEHVQLDVKYVTSAIAANQIQQSDVLLFVENYNLLVVKDGMGGIRYSNISEEFDFE